MFKFKITLDNEPIIKAKGEKLSDFDPIFETIKKKFGESKRKDYRDDY